MILNYCQSLWWTILFSFPDSEHPLPCGPHHEHWADEEKVGWAEECNLQIQWCLCRYPPVRGRQDQLWKACKKNILLVSSHKIKTLILERLTGFRFRCISVSYKLQYSILCPFSILCLDLTLFQLGDVYGHTHVYFSFWILYFGSLPSVALIRTSTFQLKLLDKIFFYAPWVDLCPFSPPASDSERDTGTHWWVCGAGVWGSEHGVYWGRPSHQRLWQDRLPAG